jgi:hypothetical protein
MNTGVLDSREGDALQHRQRGRQLWLMLVMPGVLFSGLLGLVCCREAIHVGLAVDPAQVQEEYHFGSDPMVGYGGWPYTSSRAYVTAAVLKSIVLIVSALILLCGAWLRRRGWVVVGYIGGVVFPVLMIIRGTLRAMDLI